MLARRPRAGRPARARGAPRWRGGCGRASSCSCSSRVGVSVLVAAQSAVDREYGAGDVAGARGSEEDREVGELLGLAVAAHRDLVLRLPLAVLGGVVAPDLVAHDAARRDAVHGDAVLADLARQALGPRG